MRYRVSLVQHLPFLCFFHSVPAISLLVHISRLDVCTCVRTTYMTTIISENKLTRNVNNTLWDSVHDVVPGIVRPTYAHTHTLPVNIGVYTILPRGINLLPRTCLIVYYCITHSRRFLLFLFSYVAQKYFVSLFKKSGHTRV